MARALGHAPKLSQSAAASERVDRKHAILLAAEKAFARDGYHAVSIRSIAQEAGVPLALVGYYYGTKQELFHAIFEHWSGTIEERLASLSQALQQAPNARLAAIVDAFIGPVLRLRASDEGEHYALLVARELMHASLPHASRAEVAWAYQFSLGCLLHHIVDQRVERLSQGQAVAMDAAAHALLKKFIVGGIRAALPRP
jgi:AcrR family transcriptional regulator